MNKKPKITIIIPTFNSRRSLPQCLDSILEQDYRNFEVIIIDDGSTDESAEVYNIYAHRHTQIKTITIKHSGVSTARNTGLQYTNGEWVTFVDSDDTIDKTYLSSLVNSIDKNCDLVIGRISSANEENMALDNQNNSPLSSPEEKKQLCESIFNPNSNRYPHTACSTAKLYRTSIIKKENIAFDRALQFYEDAYFVMKYIIHAENICFCNKIIYKYKISPDSTTQSYYPGIVDDYNIAYATIFNDPAIKVLYDPMSIYYLKTKDLNQILKNLIRLHYPYIEFRKVLTSHIFHQAVIKVHSKNIPKLNRIMVTLTRLHLPKLLYVVYYLRNKVKS